MGLTAPYLSVLYNALNNIPCLKKGPVASLKLSKQSRLDWKS